MYRVNRKKADLPPPSTTFRQEWITSLEGWYGRVKKLVGKEHPNIYELVCFLKKEQMSMAGRMVQYAARQRLPPNSTGTSSADSTHCEMSLLASRRHYHHRACERERKKMFYLTTHSTHFINGYMASDIWLRTILIVRKETRCRHIGYSYRLTAGFFYAPSHRQDNTYHGLCYTSRGALAGTRNIALADATSHLHSLCYVIHLEPYILWSAVDIW